MKILVVDDEVLLVKGIRYNLQSDGFRQHRGWMLDDNIPEKTTEKQRRTT